MQLSKFMTVAVTVVALAATASLVACPFCSAVAMTFCEEIGGSDVAVIAKLVSVPTPVADATQNATATVTPSKFEILDTLKGEELIGETREFETLYFGQDPVGKEFLVMGMSEKPTIAWSTPIAIMPAAKPYLKTVLTLPKEGPDRLVFFQDYLEGSEEMLARDAYDEFAKAPYSDVVGLKDHMPREKLVEWVKGDKVSPSHRRLYLTMLGICGNAEDTAMLESMIKAETDGPKAGLDALIASYLTLKGADGLPLVVDLFLKNKDAEYTETYAAIMALRFHGQEEKVIPKEQLVAAMRNMLDRPQLADLVIPDLARWEDWGSMDKLVTLFKEADDESSWVRVPVINFLRACPLPEAKTRLDELAKIDPESVERANSFFPLGGGGPPAPVPAGKSSDLPLAKADETKNPGDAAPSLSNDEIPDASTFTGAKDKDEVADEVIPSAEAEPDAAPAAEKPATDAAVPPAKSDADASVKPAAATNERAAASSLGGRSNPPPAVAANPAGVLGGLALAGLALFLVMAAVIRGGQHGTTL